MIFTELSLSGAFVVELQPIQDQRGFFADSFCEIAFGNRDLETHFVRSAVAFNHKVLTLRGMHFQASPHEEAKLVRCTAGAIYDVIIDLRKESETYGQWAAAELSSYNRKALYVPEQFAHGYLTLAPNTEVTYQISEHFNERAQRGIRYDDPSFQIVWPALPDVISLKDSEHPDYTL